MGFDPRQWSPHRDRASWSRSTSGQRVTSNVEAILRENDALRREVKRLQQELENLDASKVKAYKDVVAANPFLGGWRG